MTDGYATDRNRRVCPYFMPWGRLALTVTVQALSSWMLDLVDARQRLCDQQLGCVPGNPFACLRLKLVDQRLQLVNCRMDIPAIQRCLGILYFHTQAVV